MPIIGNRLKKGDFADLLARIQGRLGSWRTDTLSIAGRAILIQKFYKPCLLYLMTNTSVLVAVLEEIESICRKFSWTRSNSKRGVHLVAWEDVCQCRKNGGLGLRRLRPWRIALTSKHAARFSPSLKAFGFKW